ncbi:hypothetical protein LMG29542_06088 [Paraburkholderia humisilvae]|uniref:Uncharacterized protein n=1 Tax=Paraburkholderia humisilvae TaxID=627669 RepID=A0A6J5ERY1_9BURK|nr:hypothetical protein LMG29542_06088 [Paraburkholderia humisilvae]
MTERMKESKPLLDHLSSRAPSSLSKLSGVIRDVGTWNLSALGFA